MSYVIEVIESDKTHGDSLQRFLTGQGYRVITALSGTAGIACAEENNPDLVIINAVLPDGDGFGVIKKLQENQSGIPLIILSNYGTVESAIRAMKMGALDYLVKPLNYEDLKIIVRKGLMKSQQDNRRNSLQVKRKETFKFSNIIGRSPAFLAVMENVKKIASSPAATVLLQGESGTGKELVAKAIHYNSSRFQNAFVEINCSAIPEGLLEAELFGHEKGAFTGASREKKGLFEIANNGTLFLDEIGHMPVTLQAKMVKAIEEKSFRRVGGTKELFFDARIIAATHRDLLEAARASEFRMDLYYRLQVMHITLPSLRERGPTDILVLARYFKDAFNQEYNTDVKGFSTESQQALTAYSWPGNVRQLRNAIERAIILNPEDWIQPEHLQLDLDANKETSPAEIISPMDLHIPDEGIDVEKLVSDLMVKALRKTGGNKSSAAKLLGMSRDTFKYRWKKHGLDVT